MCRLRLPKVLVRSSFVALSVHDDAFSSIQELSNSARRGVFLDPKMVPIFELYDDSVYLNAYCLDFFKHGQLDALVTYNNMNRDSVWEDLQSFSLVLLGSCGLLILRNGRLNSTKVSASNIVDLPAPFVPIIRFVLCFWKSTSVN
jgi:hypothetical protein